MIKKGTPKDLRLTGNPEKFQYLILAIWGQQ